MGQRTDPRYSEGPSKKRGCTDVLCCVIFIALWLGFGIVADFALTEGKPLRIIAPYDQFGNACGLDNFTDFDFLLWIEDKQAVSVKNAACVNKCPTNSTDTIECPPDYKNTICAKNIAYETSSFAGRLCLPRDDSLVGDLVDQGAFAAGIIDKAWNDMLTVWRVQLVVLGVALAFGFIYMLFMRCCTGVIIWTLILGYIAGLIGFGFACYIQTTDSDLNDHIPDVLSSLSHKNLQIIAYSCWVVALISILILLCTCTKISLSIAVLKTASQFVATSPSILIVPPIFFLVIVGFIVGWGYVTFFLIGTNDIFASDHLPFAFIDWKDKTLYSTLYASFAGIWGLAFTIALPQFVITSACCIWYFKQSVGKSTGHSICVSIYRAVFLHAGSIAFGSLLIAIIWVIRVIMSFFENKMRAARDGSGSTWFRYCLGCAKCCLSCFERFISFINRHAFVQIAMTGHSFCGSAREAFSLAIRNAFRFGFVHGLSSFFVFIGQILISLAATIAGYYYMKHTGDYDRIYSPIFPLLAFFFIGLVVSNVFMSIYSVAADTIIHCYCMDEEMHDGVKYAPPLLNDFITKRTPEDRQQLNANKY